MKIATWNVNSIRTRKQQVRDWLSQQDVDILCVQETKVTDEEFPKDYFEETGYKCYFYGQKSYNGVAILSRSSLECLYGFSGVIPGENSSILDKQRRLMAAKIGEIIIVNVYVPNGNSVDSEKYHYKLNWLANLRRYLEVLKEKHGDKIIMCGDFNIAPEDIDIYNPQGKENHIMASEKERKALKRILDLGFIDIFRKFRKEGNNFTWWDYRQNGFVRNRGWRIDHIYVTSALEEEVLDCHIDIYPRKLEKPSDHAPVICNL
ncbi:MAG: exodeoxyribonuclease III [Geminocystis sp.]|nr:exodeoxyribonuclease III [Geminocystis sp.]HIK37689.1 exodeoxyribonuclease III [Geminocystis sp. M7585_C2015_104]MCS7147230.1 exodeoxyribonuclease III [Geminocystis sp.]MCX8078545.1 exodeoxyribonuclease III [Geminocystis sp.]MDW8116226.1 exodeoxyribonuclease III [Geminocystis sp.]